MAAIGMLLLWISYTLILYGFVLFRSYQITLLDLVVPGRWKGGWPPPTIGGGGTTNPNGPDVQTPSKPGGGTDWWGIISGGIPLGTGSTGGGTGAVPVQ